MSAGALPAGEAGVERQQALLQLAKRAGEGKLSQEDKDGCKVATRLHFDVKQQELMFFFRQEQSQKIGHIHLYTRKWDMPAARSMRAPHHRSI